MLWWVLPKFWLMRIILDEESKSAYNKIVQENATQLLDYVNNILELSRLESGKIKYVEGSCDFIGLFRAVIEEADKNGRTVCMQSCIPIWRNRWSEQIRHVYFLCLKV